MKICRKCGNKLGEEDKKCSICKENTKNAIEVNDDDKEKIEETIESIRTMNQNNPKKKMGKGKIAICIVVVLFLFIALSSGGDDTSIESEDVTANASVEQVEEDATEPETDEAEVVVTAVDLATTFDDNELNGNNLYKDKDVQVSGSINSFGEVLGSTYVTLQGGDEWSIVNVQCFFDDEDDIATLATMSEGDDITIRGICDGMSLNVTMSDCYIVQ